MPVAAAARVVGAGRATLHDWLGRYRAEGVAGLRDRPRGGRPRLLTPGQAEALKARLEAGPDHAGDGATAFRGVDLRRILKAESAVGAGLSSACQLAHRLGWARIAPRPQHPRGDAAAQAAFEQPSRPG